MTSNKLYLLSQPASHNNNIQDIPGTRQSPLYALIMKVFLVSVSLMAPCLLPTVTAFMGTAKPSLTPCSPLNLSQEVETATPTTSEDQQLRSQVASKFKVLTCTSTACAKKRKACGLDEYATFGAMYTRAAEDLPEITVEESPCLGSCKMAPCIAIEHEDYEGTVALEGMTPIEFQKSWYAHKGYICIFCLLKFFSTGRNNAEMPQKSIHAHLLTLYFYSFYLFVINF